MFEEVVASFLNKFLEKYVENLNVEYFNVGILGGNVTLQDLKIKPDALFELGLPIRVKFGTVGKLSLTIPWTKLWNQANVLNLEDIFIIACPCTFGSYDENLEKLLRRSEKHLLLSALNDQPDDNADSGTLGQTLLANLANNTRINLQNIHVRYEDCTDAEIPIALGFCLQNFSVETTNSKWKCVNAGVSKSGPIYQLAKIDSLSLYCNPCCTVLWSKDDFHTSWILHMKKSLENFTSNGEAFDFIMKPVSARVKIIANKSAEMRTMILFVDFVLQDVALQLSHHQYVALLKICDSVPRIQRNKMFWKFRPNVESVKNNAFFWWKYAVESVLEAKVRPCMWRNILRHRENYRKYKEIFEKTLLFPDMELKLDLQNAEDSLDIVNVLVAREHAKLTLLKKHPNVMVLKRNRGNWWDWSRDVGQKLYFKAENGNNFWKSLSGNEREDLFRIIGYDFHPNGHHYIEHKFNFSIANANFTLISGGYEIFVATLSHLGALLETKPAVKAFKIAAKIESLLVEGSSVEYSLTPIVISENVSKSNREPNFLTVEFEINAGADDVCFSFRAATEYLECIYHEFSMSMLKSFLHTPKIAIGRRSLKKWAHKCWNFLNETPSEVVNLRRTLNINLDLKLPHFIIPEFGSLQKRGHILILDLGRLKFWSEFYAHSQSYMVEDSHSDYEDKFYDQFHVHSNDFQIMIFDQDQDYKNFKKVHSARYHILSKIQSQVLFSNAANQEYNSHPKFKFNVTLQTIKVNISDNRVVILMNFFKHLPFPKNHTVSEQENCRLDQIYGGNDLGYLNEIGTIVAAKAWNEINVKNGGEKDAANAVSDFPNGCMTTPGSEDLSEEIWAHMLDLPGFQDNISPCNNIRWLLRVSVTQIIVELKKTNNHIDKPYVVLHAANISSDVAFMDFGPAVQFSLGSLNVTDKAHSSCLTRHVQLVNASGRPEFLTMLYRKVAWNCPDFKSHFHGVGTSFVVNANSAQFVLHRNALNTLYNYFTFILDKISIRVVGVVRDFCIANCLEAKKWFERECRPCGKDDDSGKDFTPKDSTKFSYSIRMGGIRVRLCDSNSDFVYISLEGLECDCAVKADERLLLRLYATFLNVDDVSNTTLYSKILTTEEDKLLELKYVRYGQKDGGFKNKCCDGSFTLFVGRIQLTLLLKLYQDARAFWQAVVLPPSVAKLAIPARKLTKMVRKLFPREAKLRLSIRIELPTLLLPQKFSSPCLIILHCGDLTVENFIKETGSVSARRRSIPYPLLDNILAKLEHLSVSRAIVDLNGSILVQEPIVNGTSAKMDAKRIVSVDRSNKLSFWDVSLRVDSILATAGQKDVATLVAIWTENFKRGDLPFSIMHTFHHLASVLHSNVFLEVGAESEVISHLKIGMFDAIVESAHLRLYSDIDEALSSPMRDENHALCEVKVGEIAFRVIYYMDRCEMEGSVECFSVKDIRVDNLGPVKNIFQSWNIQSGCDKLSVTALPVFSLTVKQYPRSETLCDVVVDRTRLNLSVPFFTDLLRFFAEAVPRGECRKTSDGGVVNYGYVGEYSAEVKHDGNNQHEIPLPCEGARKTMRESFRLNVYVNCRKQEIMIFSLKEHPRRNAALLLRMELGLNFTIHSLGRFSLNCKISGTHVLSKLQLESPESSACLVLHPCDVEISKFSSMEKDEVDRRNLGVSISCSPMEVDVSASTMHILMDIMDDFHHSLEVEEDEDSYPSSKLEFECEDLLQPKNVAPYVLPQKNAASQMEGRDADLLETMRVVIPNVNVMFHMEDVVQKVPVLLVSTRVNFTAINWSQSLQLKGEVSLACSYFNSDVGVWEPLLEPCGSKESEFRHFKIQIRVFRWKSHAIEIPVLRSGLGGRPEECRRRSIRQRRRQSTINMDSETSSDEEEGDRRSMKFIRAVRPNAKIHAIPGDRVKIREIEADSDSDNDENLDEKLKISFNQLLNCGSDIENSNSDTEISAGEESKNVRNKAYSSEIEGEMLPEMRGDKTLYLVMDARDRLELTLSSYSMDIMKRLVESFAQTTAGNILPTNAKLLSLTNYLGPDSIVCLFSKCIPDKPLITANYCKREDSDESSQDSSADSDEEMEEKGHCSSDSPEEKDVDSFKFEGNFPLDIFSKEYVSRMKRVPDPVSGEQIIKISVKGFEELVIPCPKKSESSVLPLRNVTRNLEFVVVVCVKNDLWGKSIIVRSHFQIKNECVYTLGLYYKRSVLEGLGLEHIGKRTNPFDECNRFAILEPDQLYSVPIAIASHCPIHILPAYGDFQVSELGIWWKDSIGSSGASDLVCKMKENASCSVFAIRAICVEDSASTITLRFFPALSLRNLMPCPVRLKLSSCDLDVRMEAGEKMNVYSVKLGETQSVAVEIHLGSHRWTGSFPLDDKLRGKFARMCSEDEEGNESKHFSIGIHIECQESFRLSIYSPYWIVNKTGLPLHIRASMSDVAYELPLGKPLFFSFRKLGQHRKVRLRIHQSSWSSAFPLDTSYCTGLVICKDKERNMRYQILLNIKPAECDPGLIKIVTLTPYFLITNQYNMPLRYMEENERVDLWMDIAENETIPFWPQMETMKMRVKHKNGSCLSQYFNIETPGQSVLHMDKWSALTACVSCQEETPVLITLRPYHMGDAPVRIDNYCSQVFLKIKQQSLDQVTVLSPYQSLLYTWDDPTRDRKLVWSVYNNSGKNGEGFFVELASDGYGKERANICKNACSGKTMPQVSISGKDVEEGDSDDSHISNGICCIHWVSYLEQNQRVLLFTQDEELAFYTRTKIESEPSLGEFFLALSGIGVSLVQNKESVPARELAYVSVNDSSSTWEVKIAESWKMFPVDLAAWMEHKWLQGVKSVAIDDYVLIDFTEMRLMKPFFGTLRRTQRPGIWSHGRKSCNYTSFKWEIYDFQIDDQTSEGIVFNFIPSPTSDEFGKIPRLEGFFLKKRQLSYDSDNTFYKIVNASIGEFSLNVNGAFLANISDFLSPWLRRKSLSLKVGADICFVYRPLMVKADDELQRVVVEHFQISPLKIRFSYSPWTGLKRVVHTVPHSVNVAFNFLSILPRVEELCLHCCGYEECRVTCEILKKLHRHYAIRIMKELYVLVLGLDVLGIPGAKWDFKIERNSDDYDDEYLNGRDEWGVKIEKSIRRLLHYISDARCSNFTMEEKKCFDFCFDERAKLDPRYVFKNNIYRYDDCFEIGVLHGMAAAPRGYSPPPDCGNFVQLFFKNKGKRLMRFLHNDSAFKYDFRNTAFDVFIRTMDSGLEDIACKRRLPRNISPLGINPYSIHEAIGLNLWKLMEPNECPQDYWDHFITSPNGKNCLFLTLKRIVLIQNMKSVWKIMWDVSLSDISDICVVGKDKLIVKICPSKFSETNVEKVIQNLDEDLLVRIREQIKTVVNIR